ncbi:MAG: hypothetical protein JST90_07095 [Bacteroidetes bacterium]|nr:hypothetical protein [Bacteroidota bacterium]
MQLKITVKEVLQFLLESYTNDGGSLSYDIGEIANRNNINIHELGAYLKVNGWVKDGHFLPTSFRCAISRSGIHYIAPHYFSDLMENLIITAGLTNDWTSIMESLPFEPKDFQRAFDLGKEIEAVGLAEVQNLPTDVFVKLTLSGRERYEKRNNGGFFNG